MEDFRTQQQFSKKQGRGLSYENSSLFETQYAKPISTPGLQFLQLESKFR